MNECDGQEIMSFMFTPSEHEKSPWCTIHHKYKQ
jgi:hypothetical protein